jgi:hypothetical protein
VNVECARILKNIPTTIFTKVPEIEVQQNHCSLFDIFFQFDLHQITTQKPLETSRKSRQDTREKRVSRSQE